MTQIHGNAAPIDRIDNGTVRQKRLLQDLERQWLDSWGQAGQLQSPAVIPLDTRSPAGDSGGALRGRGAVAEAANASVSASRQVSEPLAARGKKKTDLAGADYAATERVAMETQMTASATVARADDRVARPAAGSIQPGGTSDVESASVGDTAGQPAGGWGKTPVITAAQSRRSLPAISSPPSSPAGTLTNLGVSLGDARTDALHQGISMPDDGSTTGAKADTALVANPLSPMATEVTRSASARQAYIPFGRVPQEQAQPVASFTPATASLGPTALTALAANQPGLQNSTSEGNEAHAAATRRHFPAPSQNVEPAPQHLMLRELSDQEVLASMRDAHLGSVESQIAAQELARALMQAGYARVQVVVNGHQRKHGDAQVEGSASGESSPPTDAAPDMNSHIQSAHHGN